MTENNDKRDWLVLVYQFRKGPDSRRVRIWRRLQAFGAVAIKNSVYVLPSSEQSHEDFAWLLEELRSAGADGVILESAFVDGMSDAEVREIFNVSRNSDYQELLDELTATISAIRSRDPGNDSGTESARRMQVRARKRIAEIEAIDFFSANLHDDAARAIQSLHKLLIAEDGDLHTGGNKVSTSNIPALSGKTWVTRRGVHVDRIASAWLIRRWIDSEAAFKFVAPKGYVPADDELRFDMYEAEYTHEGDKCTFEVLTELVDTQDDALQRIAEIVHDIDLKDKKFGRSEADGVALLLGGIAAGTDNDNERLKRGAVLFEDLYRSFANARA